MNDVKFADTEEKVLHCLEAIQALQPHVTKETVLVYFHAMHKENYHLIYIEENGKAVAFAGYRYMTHFYSDAIIYIDDLGTIEAYRGKGYGSKLLDFIFTVAKENKLVGVHLDSGHHRHHAHRLYLNKGFTISAHHFIAKL